MFGGAWRAGAGSASAAVGRVPLDGAVLRGTPAMQAGMAACTSRYTPDDRGDQADGVMSTRMGDCREARDGTVVSRPRPSRRFSTDLVEIIRLARGRRAEGPCAQRPPRSDAPRRGTPALAAHGGGRASTCAAAAGADLGRPPRPVPWVPRDRVPPRSATAAGHRPRGRAPGRRGRWPWWARPTAGTGQRRGARHHGSATGSTEAPRCWQGWPCPPWRGHVAACRARGRRVAAMGAIAWQSAAASHGTKRYLGTCTYVPPDIPPYSA